MDGMDSHITRATRRRYWGLGELEGDGDIFDDGRSIRET